MNSQNKKLENTLPPYSPIFYLLGNLFVPGLSYILLRQYLNLLVFMVLLYVSILFPFIFIEFIVILFSSYDAYTIAKKLKNMPEDNKLKKRAYNNTIIIVAWLGSLIFAVILFIWVHIYSLNSI